MTDHDAEMDALVAMLEEADLVEQYTDEDGRPALRLTAKGASSVAMAMAGDDAGAEAMLDALLDARDR